MENRFTILTGNQLKLIAAAAMLLDHMGILLFPRITIFRILGRLAYPVFAFMIAEGCRYTRNKLRYFLMLFGLGTGVRILSPEKAIEEYKTKIWELQQLF